jgi:hypothetical protein
MDQDMSFELFLTYKNSTPMKKITGSGGDCSWQSHPVKFGSEPDCLIISITNMLPASENQDTH